VTLAWVDPFSGASGDMLLGAVVDAGIALDDLVAVLAGLGVDGWRLEARDVVRGGIGATQVTVDVDDRAVTRTWRDVRALLHAATLPDVVRARALATFTRLAEAEARVHRVAVEDVHFHEVGALDALVDVVGVCVGLHRLGVTALHCGPVAQGTGSVSTAHGDLPLPAPAVLELLRGAPTFAAGVAVELCTPTGAALLAEWTVRWGDLPAMIVERVGYGAGSRDLPGRANVVRLVLGTADGDAGPPTTQALLLETTIDDLPGELVPPLLDALRGAGASDAWARPVLMKKGRPGLEIACLAPPERGEALRGVLFRESTTLGVRGRLVDKWALAREFATVDVAGAPVRVKVGRLDGTVVNVAPEFADCEAAARATGLPLKEVFARARAAWDAQRG
jgi:uncharacterized protein (TIGR00299 family) protein